MSNLKDLLSKNSKAALSSVQSNFRFKEKVTKKSKEPRDRSLESAQRLRENLDLGIFKIPMSDLPMDFHRFHAVFRDTAFGDWRDLMCQEYGINHVWAFNMMTSNYPTLSVPRSLVSLNRILFKQDHPVAVREWKYLLAFVETFADEEALGVYLKCTASSKIRRQYDRFVQMNGLKIPRYTQLAEVGEQQLALDFFRQQVLMATPMKAVMYKSRAFFPLAPKQMLTEKSKQFKILSLRLITERA